MTLSQTIRLLTVAWLCALAFSAAAQSAVPNAADALEDDPLLNGLSAEFDAGDGRGAEAAAKYAEQAESNQDVAAARRAAQLALQLFDYPLLGRMARIMLAADPSDLAGLQFAAMSALAAKQADAAAPPLIAILRADRPRTAAAVLNILNHPEAVDSRAEVLRLIADDELAAAVPAEQGSLVPLALQLKDYATADKLLAAALSAHPDSPKTWLWRGLADAAKEDYPAAIASYDKALKLDPENANLRMTYAGLLESQGRADEVDALLQKAPTKTPDLLAARAAFADKAGNTRLLKRIYSDVKADRDLEEGERWFLAGQLAELLEQDNDALGHYESIAQGKRFPEAQLRRSILLAKTDIDAARAVLVPLKTQSDNVELNRSAFLVDAELLGKARRYDEAAEVLSLALSEHAEDADILYARALTYVNGGQVDYALTDLRLLSTRQPDNAQVLNAYGYTLADHTDRLDEARELIERALAIEPEDPAILDSMGWVLFRQGNPADAYPHIQRAYAISPDPEIAAHLGEVLMALDRPDEAKTVFSKGLESTADHPVLNATVKRLMPSLLP